MPTMPTPPTSTAKPTLIPETYTTTVPAESFPNPTHGTTTWHTLISYPQTLTDSLSAGIAVCPPRTGHLAAHRHAQAEIYHVLSGCGTVIVDGVEHVVEAGCTVFIPGDAEHEVLNRGEEPLRWFYVFPTGCFGDVVYRFVGEAL